jgi:hypothetical protein
MAAASAVMSTSRLGQSGTLSGFQLFAKINCTLAQLGQEQVDTPPLRSQFADLAPQDLVITNMGGVVALKLTCPTDPGQNTIVRGSKPVSQGVDGWESLPRIYSAIVPRRRAKHPPGVRAVEQLPAPGVKAGGCPPGRPPALARASAYFAVADSTCAGRGTHRGCAP